MFRPEAGRCECSQPIPEDAAFAQELAAIVCDPATADVRLWLTSTESMPYNALQVTCIDATPTNRCEEMRLHANSALVMTAVFASSTSNGCLMSE